MDASGPLKFIFYNSRALGLFPFSFHTRDGIFVFEQSEKALIYSKILTIVFVLCQIYVIIHGTYAYLNFTTEHLSKAILLFTVFCLIFSYVMIYKAVFNPRSQTEFCYWLNKIGFVFSNLQEKHYRKITRFYYVVFGGMLFFAILAVTAEHYLYNIIYLQVGDKIENDSPGTLIAAYYILEFEIKMFIQLFIMFVNFLRFYHSEIHEVLRPKIKTTDRELWLGYLRSLRSNDLLVNDLMDFLHSYFVPVISLQLLWGFFATLFTVSVSTKAGVPPVVQLFWSIYIFWDTFLIVADCDCLVKKDEQTVHCLHELFITWDDKELKKEIDIFSLQLLHRKLEFNALGCHKLNYTLIYTMIGMLSSHIVILAQFQQSKEEKNCNVKSARNLTSL